MKDILFKIIWLFVVMGICYQGHSQNLNPYLLPCVSYGGGAGTSSAYNCIVSPGTYSTVNVTGTGSHNVVSATEINFQSGFGVNTDFHAYIQSSVLDIAVFDPVDLSQGVLKHEKLEVGIKIPEPIKTYINNFITNSGTPRINPFNPEDIDVYAEFQSYHANNSFFHNYWGQFENKKINGFYYEEFEEDTSDTNVDNWHHVAVNTDYKFRIRFSPPVTGSWRGRINVLTPYGNFTSDYFFFNCFDSGNPGYVYVGQTSKRFLKLGNEMFFPVGHTIYSSDRVKHPASTGYGPWSTDRAKVAEMVYFRNTLKRYSENGGYYFRYLNAPWSTELEFEKLNNYYDRLPGAWEFDRILEVCKDADLRMHLDIETHTPVENPTPAAMCHWDWTSNTMDNLTNTMSCWDNAAAMGDGYCYHTELNLPTPVDMFADATAKEMFKRKLRYIVARWGYSTNIGALELFSEANNLGKGPACGNMPATEPYVDDPAVPGILNTWHNEMAQFIKTDLEHDQHLIAVSYAGFPSAEDYSYESPYVDLPTFNYYTGCHDRFHVLKQHVNEVIFEEDIQGFHGFKPVVISETGNITCDGGYEVKKSIWVTPFTGVAGVMEWENQDDQLQIWGEDHFNHFRDFISGLDFDQGDWIPQHDYRQDDDKADVFALVDISAHKAIGVIMNRTFNYATADPVSCANHVCDCGICFDQKSEVVPAPSGGNKLELGIEEGPLSNQYRIDWFDVLENQSLGTSYISSNWLGNLELNHPPLSVDQYNPNDFQPVIGFHIWRVGDNFRSMDVTTGKGVKAPGLKVTPNPNNGSFMLTSTNNDIGTVRVMDMLGQVIFESKNNTGSSMHVDIGHVYSGVYIVEVQSPAAGSLVYKRIVIEY